jgi:hypothetical protein
MSRGMVLRNSQALSTPSCPRSGEFTGPIYKQPPPSVAEYSIRDIVSEAAQRLEHAGLLIPKHYESNGNWTHLGWGTTRLGRTALTDWSVERRIEPSAPPAEPRERAPRTIRSTSLTREER